MFTQMNTAILPEIPSAGTTGTVVAALRRKFSAGPRPFGAVALDADAGARHIYGTFGVHWKIDGADTGGRLDRKSVV